MYYPTCISICYVSTVHVAVPVKIQNQHPHIHLCRRTKGGEGKRKRERQTDSAKERERQTDRDIERKRKRSILYAVNYQLRTNLHEPVPRTCSQEAPRKHGHCSHCTTMSNQPTDEREPGNICHKNNRQLTENISHTVHQPT